MTQKELSAIQHLYLARKNIKSLKVGDFEYLSSLQTLGLSGNQSLSVPDGVFQPLNSLQTLDLSATRIQLSSGTLRGLAVLQNLYLNSNGYRTLPPGVFQYVYYLEELYLQNNPLSPVIEGPLPNGVFTRNLGYLRKVVVTNTDLSLEEKCKIRQLVGRPVQIIDRGYGSGGALNCAPVYPS